MLPLLSRLRLLVGLFLVAVATIRLGVYLYFGRIQHYSSWFFHSDFAVFGMPAVAGFSGFFYVIWKSLPFDYVCNRKLVTCSLFSPLLPCLYACLLLDSYRSTVGEVDQLHLVVVSAAAADSSSAIGQTLFFPPHRNRIRRGVRAAVGECN